MSKIILPDSLSPALGLSPSQQDCVGKLREALDEAEAGRVWSLGLVLCMKDGFAKVIGGSNAAELNLGLDALKQDILKAVYDDRDAGRG